MRASFPVGGIPSQSKWVVGYFAKDSQSNCSLLRWPLYLLWGLVNPQSRCRMYFEIHQTGDHYLGSSSNSVSSNSLNFYRALCKTKETIQELKVPCPSLDTRAWRGRCTIFHAWPLLTRASVIRKGGRKGGRLANCISSIHPGIRIRRFRTGQEREDSGGRGKEGKPARSASHIMIISLSL